MRDISCKLLSTTLITDSIGVQKEKVEEIEIPIIRSTNIGMSTLLNFSIPFSTPQNTTTPVAVRNISANTIGAVWAVIKPVK